jgi:FkbM family methyltransferase
MFTIKYGINTQSIDVTEISYETLMTNNIIRIPKHDTSRAMIFTDSVPGVKKNIIVYCNGIESSYNDTTEVYIDTINGKVYTIGELFPTHIIETYPEIIVNTLIVIHRLVPLKHGWFMNEFPEQKMAVRFLTGNEKILEIGSNIGRNTFVMSYILNKNNNNKLVSLESNNAVFAQLVENKNATNLDCFLENAALSKRNLIQNPYLWNTIVSDEVPEGYQKVNTITFDELEKKYNITFDTLVMDCEGAFYYILLDMPEILDNINLIIMENDYDDIEHKKYIDSLLKEKGLSVVYSEGDGWGPCADNFYEVWKRDIPTSVFNLSK